MLNIVKTSFEKKQFFSKNFSVSIKLNKNGTLTGSITYFAATLKLTKCFEGFYCLDEDNIDVVFWIDWSEVNLHRNILTAFSGRIFSYEYSHICLILKWLRIIESCALPEPFCSNDFEILLDSPSKDPASEQEKILSRISFEVF